MRWSLRPILLGIATFALACTDGDGGSDDGDGTGGGTGDTSASSATTSETSGTDTGETSSETMAETMEPSYRAVFVSGDPNQLQIMQRDDAEGRCNWLVLTDDVLTFLAITTPSGWVARTGYTNDRPDACEGNPGASGSRQGSGGNGSIDEAMPGTLAPCALDFDFSLDFEGFTANFAATGVPVEGCE